MSEWIEQYGYWAVMVGTFLEGEGSYLTGVVMSRLTAMNTFWVMVCGYIGGFLRDSTLYYLARRGSKMRWITRRITEEKLLQVRKWIDAQPIYLLVFHRFIYGISTATVLVLGMTRINPYKFIMINLIACLLWVIGYAMLGYFFTDLVRGWIN